MNDTLTGLYPSIEPYETGVLEVSGGHRLVYELCGNPSGRPVVFLHGGPGAGCNPTHRRFFDPSVYKIVLFDQRGAGRSTPTASVHENTTQHLVSDIETLRRHLRIDRWVVFGGSWGSTLGLAYAQAHPDRVRAIVLFSVGTTTRREVEWITRDMGRVWPAEWARFRAGVPEAERDGSLVDAYARLLHDDDPAVRDAAAAGWCAWETAHMGADPRWEDPVFRLCFARLVTHYFRHAAFLEDGALMRGLDRLADIPGVLIHGSRDVSSPLYVAWHITRRWGQLIVVDEGHRGGAAMEAQIEAALDRFSGA
jgi:proline iminopeptidase